MPSVPPPADTGADGFPELPAVAMMLKDADATMKTINAEASSLAKRVAQAQEEKAAKMTKQKAIFDEKLHTQEAGNRAMLAANGKISEEIATLKGGNAAIVKHATELQAANKLMRSELSTLAAKLGIADKFVAAALSATDDSRAKELAVLRPAPKAVRARGARKQMRAAFAEVAKRSDDDTDDGEDGEDDGQSAQRSSEEDPQPAQPAQRPEPASADGEEDDDQVSLLAVARRTDDDAAPAKAAPAKVAAAPEPQDLCRIGVRLRGCL